MMNGRRATRTAGTARVLDDIAAIAAISDPGIGVTRVAYSEPDARARAWFARRCEALGLTCEVDRYGNCFGWSPGAGERPAVLLGSHLDSVREAGRYDGVLGVVVGFEVARRALEQDPHAAVGVVSFACEESTRFGVPTLGSRLLLGHLGPESLDALRDLDGATLRAVLERAGLDPRASTSFDPDRIAAFVEVHVDQGTTLADSHDVGVVSAIAGTVRERFAWHGETAHSGAQRRGERRDALLGAARLIVAAEELWQRVEAAGETVTVTVGWLESRPNAPNAVSGRADVIVDLRSPAAAALAAMREELETAALRIAGASGLRVEHELLGRIEPVAMDDDTVFTLCAAATAAGIAHRVTPSMAGHDAEVLAHHVPTAMLFVANPAGVSHAPEEAVDEPSLDGAIALLEAALPALGRNTAHRIHGFGRQEA